MLRPDWCNIVFKDEWLPDEVPCLDTVLTKEEYLEETKVFNYFDKLCIIAPWIRDNRNEFTVVNNRSGSRYQNGFCLGSDFFIYWDDTCTNKGLFMEFPSHGLYKLYEWLNIDIKSGTAFYELCTKLWSIGCRFSRIDICKDVKKEGCKFSPFALSRLYVDGRIVSRLRNVELDASVDLPIQDLRVPDMRYIEAGHNGSTFYLGSLSNRRKILRVYDKEAESGDPKQPYYRWEVELHGDYARQLMKTIVDGEIVAFSSIIESFFYVIKENNNNTNRCQVKRDEEFELFKELEFKEEIPSDVDLTPHKKDVSRENQERWVHQCMPKFASILWSMFDSKDRHLMSDLIGDIDAFEYWCKDNDLEGIYKETIYYMKKNSFNGLY